jgi:uncharacterized protein
VKSVIPAIKALMAKELVEKHGMKQNEVAELLGISQSAVSKYTKKTRGYVIRIDHIEEIQVPINSMIALAVNGTYERTDFLRLFCQTCLIIRRKGVICQHCQKTEPKIGMNQCTLCLASYPVEKER